MSRTASGTVEWRGTPARWWARITVEKGKDGTTARPEARRERDGGRTMSVLNLTIDLPDEAIDLIDKIRFESYAMIDPSRAAPDRDGQVRTMKVALALLAAIDEALAQRGP